MSLVYWSTAVDSCESQLYIHRCLYVMKEKMTQYKDTVYKGIHNRSSSSLQGFVREIVVSDNLPVLATYNCEINHD